MLQRIDDTLSAIKEQNLKETLGTLCEEAVALSELHSMLEGCRVKKVGGLIYPAMKASERRRS